MEYTTLNNGVKMPMEGFGVFRVRDLDQCEQAVCDALEADYRLIDTAASYMNEEAVGRAIKKSGVAREEIFLTTKLWPQDYGYENAKKAIDARLEALDVEYLDLLLLHQAYGDYVGAYRAMEEAYKEGKLKAIGVSNFYPARLVDLIYTVDVVPAVNQVELNPLFQQPEALKVMKEYGVQAEAWAPFAEGKENIFTNPVLEEIASAHHKSVGQVMLRWNVQRGVVVIPKSVHKNRIEENINIWDFELSEEEMEKIATLDLGKSLIIDHDSLDLIRMVHERKIHD